MNRLRDAVIAQTIWRWRMVDSAWTGSGSASEARDLLAAWAGVQRLTAVDRPVDLRRPQGDLVTWKNSVNPEGLRQRLVDLDRTWADAGPEQAADVAADLLRWCDVHSLAAWAATEMGVGDDEAMNAIGKVIAETCARSGLFAGICDLADQELASWDPALLFTQRGLWSASRLWSAIADVREEGQEGDPSALVLALSQAWPLPMTGVLSAAAATDTRSASTWPSVVTLGAEGWRVELMFPKQHGADFLVQVLLGPGAPVSGSAYLCCLPVVLDPEGCARIPWGIFVAAWNPETPWFSLELPTGWSEGRIVRVN